MRRFIKILSVFFLTGIIMFSCEEADEKIFEQEAVQFATDEINANVLKEPAQNETASFTVELTCAPLDKDVTISFKPYMDDEITALEGEHYEVLNTSVTIPAGKAKATVDYAEIIHEHFMVEEQALAKVKFNSDKSDVPPVDASQGNYLSIKMKKLNVCPLEYTDIEGIWEVNEVSAYDGTYAPYQIELEHVEGNTMLAKGLWNFTIEGQRSDITCNVDLTPGKETFAIPKQDFAVHSTHGQVFFEGSGSSINTCEKTITASYSVYVGAGNFDVITESVWTYVGPGSKEQKNVPFERMDAETLKK